MSYVAVYDGYDLTDNTYYVPYDTTTSGAYEEKVTTDIDYEDVEANEKFINAYKIFLSLLDFASKDVFLQDDYSKLLIKYQQIKPFIQDIIIKFYIDLFGLKRSGNMNKYQLLKHKYETFLKRLRKANELCQQKIMKEYKVSKKSLLNKIKKIDKLITTLEDNIHRYLKLKEQYQMQIGLKKTYKLLKNKYVDLLSLNQALKNILNKYEKVKKSTINKNKCKDILKLLVETKL